MQSVTPFKLIVEQKLAAPTLGTSLEKWKSNHCNYFKTLIHCLCYYKIKKKKSNQIKSTRFFIPPPILGREERKYNCITTSILAIEKNREIFNVKISCLFR